jgi:hypothetical protein
MLFHRRMLIESRISKIDLPLLLLQRHPTTTTTTVFNSVSHATDDRGKRVTDDVRGYKCDVCAYEDKVAMLMSKKG